jgi:hypothetical protein
MTRRAGATEPEAVPGGEVETAVDPAAGGFAQHTEIRSPNAADGVGNARG